VLSHCLQSRRDITIIYSLSETRLRYVEVYFTFGLKAILDQNIKGPSAYVIFSNGVARSKRLGTTGVDSGVARLCAARVRP